jgi:hypothetical protein
MPEWRPRADSVKLLDYAMANIKSVPYKVSSRWTFYRVLQAGLIPDKKYIIKYDYLISRARKRFYGDWRPDTLVDSIRRTYFRGEFHAAYEVELDTTVDQDFYVQLWFEAEAMHEQFKYYSKDYRVSLVPFRGDCSIPIKWEIAKKLEAIADKYGKPIKILYFGDYDKKGFQILEAALRDIKAWCKIPFDIERVGLTEEQARTFNLPENPDHPGYQWEALEDQHAKTLILGALSKYQKPVKTQLVMQEEFVQDRIREAMIGILKTHTGEDFE